MGYSLFLKFEQILKIKINKYNFKNIALFCREKNKVSQQKKMHL